MSKVKSVPQYPTVAAFSPGPTIVKDRPHLANTWLVPCPWCERVHVHGAAPGLRSSHCSHPEGPTAFLLVDGTRPEAYVLEYSGELDDLATLDASTEKTKAKYKAHYEGFENRREARRRAPTPSLP